MSDTKKTKKRICDISFQREKGLQTLYIKTVPALESLFKNPKTEESEHYKDDKGKALEYYKLSDILERYTSEYSQNQRVNVTRYGTTLILDGYIVNASILRTVGISKGITIVVDDLISDDLVKSYIESLAKYIKYLHQNFINKTEVKAIISLEL